MAKVNGQEYLSEYHFYLILAKRPSSDKSIIFNIDEMENISLL